MYFWGYDKINDLIFVESLFIKQTDNPDEIGEPLEESFEENHELDENMEIEE